MLIRNRIRERLLSVISEIPDPDAVRVIIADPRFGDYASNVALEGAKWWKKPPPIIAKEIKEKLLAADYPEIAKVEIAGPGFINFTISHELRKTVLGEILSRQNSSPLFPDLDKTNAGKKILLEYVSANPTGPLHVGHGRWAVIGSILARVLAATGADIHQEFYINDAGLQIQKLRDSVTAAREGNPIPEDGYHGDYVKDLAQSHEDPVAVILRDQKRVLESVGVNMDEFFSEKSLYDQGLVAEMLDYLKTHGLAYQQDSAWWFPSTRDGDDKDRVLVRSNGEITYFGVDIAYHYTKFTRGYTHLIDVLGADHHGYVKRIASAVKMISKGAARVEAVIGQLVSVLRGGKPVRMSKRMGDFVLLEDVVKEIGNDAFRYFFSMRSPNMPLEFDLDLAKSQSLENPVFYVQYSHARICSVREKAAALGISPISLAKFDFSLIANPTSTSIVNKLMEWEEEILLVSQNYEIQHINNYLYDLSTLFHRYYNQEIFISDKTKEDLHLSSHRLFFLEAIDKVLREGLWFLGITAPDRM